MANSIMLSLDEGSSQTWRERIADFEQKPGCVGRLQTRLKTETLNRETEKPWMELTIGSFQMWSRR